MPIAFDPNQTINVYLDYDTEKNPDEKTRPGFVVKFPTARDRVRIHELFRQHDAEQDAGKKIDLLIESAKVIVLRTVNLDRDLDSTLNSLTAKEIDELTEKMLKNTRLTEEEYSKRAAQRQSGSAASAQTVEKPAAV